MLYALGDAIRVVRQIFLPEMSEIFRTFVEEKSGYGMELNMEIREFLQIDFSTGICIEWLLVLGITTATVFHIPGMVSLLFAASFLVLLIMLIQYFGEKGVSYTLIFLCALSIIDVCINAIMSVGTSFSFSFFKKVIMFICTMTFFYAASEVKLKDYCYRFMVNVSALIGVIMIISYFLLGNKATIARGITLGFVNPNFASMWLVHAGLYLIYYAADTKILYRKITAGILCLLCLCLINLTLARSCLVGVAAFLFLMGMRLIDSKWIRSRTLLMLIAIVPLIVVFIYLNVVNEAWFHRTFRFIVSNGKKLNARLDIWQNALSHFYQNIITGDYSGLSSGRGVFQLHNTHIDVLCSYGLVSFCLFIKSYYDVMKKAADNTVDLKQYIALCGFITVLVVGCFEASIVAGSTGLYLLTGGLLFLANRQDEE